MVVTPFSIGHFLISHRSYLVVSTVMPSAFTVTVEVPPVTVIVGVPVVFVVKFFPGIGGSGTSSMAVVPKRSGSLLHNEKSWPAVVAMRQAAAAKEMEDIVVFICYGRGVFFPRAIDFRE